MFKRCYFNDFISDKFLKDDVQSRRWMNLIKCTSLDYSVSWGFSSDTLIRFEDESMSVLRILLHQINEFLKLAEKYYNDYDRDSYTRVKKIEQHHLSNLFQPLGDLIQCLVLISPDMSGMNDDDFLASRCADNLRTVKYRFKNYDTSNRRNDYANGKEEINYSSGLLKNADVKVLWKHFDKNKKKLESLTQTPLPDLRRIFDIHVQKFTDIPDDRRG